MNKVNCYWIIDVRSGRKSGYSFAVKTLESEEDWPCDSSRYIEDIIEAACKIGLFDNENDAYGCGIQGPFSEDDIGDDWKEDAAEIDYIP